MNLDLIEIGVGVGETGKAAKAVTDAQAAEAGVGGTEIYRSYLRAGVFRISFICVLCSYVS